MKTMTRFHAVALAAFALAAAATTAQAQSSSTAMPSDPSASSSAPVLMAQSGSTTGTGSGMYGTGDAYSLLPFTRHGYVGIDIGRTRLDSACGTGGYACEDPNATAHIYTGGLVNDWLGAEIGYFRTTNADRAGGNTRIQGFNASAVLRAPIGAFNAYVKAGGVYGEARVSTGALSNVAAGKKRGWGPSYSAGVGYDFLPNSGVVLDWTRNEVKFPNGGSREKIDTTSLGYVFRF